MVKNKPVAIVTNATEYAGPGSVDALVREGFQLVCQDVKFADAAVRDSCEVLGNRIASMAPTPEALVAETIERYGRIDAVISNDFAFPEASTIDALTADDFRETIETLTVAPFRLCAAASATMKQQQRGHIVLITSGAGMRNPVTPVFSGTGNPAYVVGREAANTLVRCMAVELAPFGVQVNAVAPFFVYSQSFFPSPLGGDDPQFAGLLESHVPMRRFGRAEEIGALVALLCSEKAAFVSGQVISFSGAGA